jgi:hypothetical protein
MKKVFLFSLLLSFFPLIFAQQEFNRCATPEYMDYMMKMYPEIFANMEQIEQDIQEHINSDQRDGRSPQTVFTIPVVVHVVWNTTAQNISDQMVASQIRVMNEDFRKMSGTPGWNNHPAGADVKVQFKLADRDPNGLPHSGINRIFTTKTSFSYTTDDALLKGLSYWPSQQYLNIWTCNISGGILGYSPYPGGPAARDGVVILFSAFGDNSPAYPYNKGRTTTHEVGHWLNLIHLWGDVNTCFGTDYCEDTPPCSGQYFSQVPSCPVPSQCSNLRQIQNYMDYSDDGCMNMFTNDQTSRMRAAISVYRFNLLASQKETMTVSQTGTDYNFTDILSQPFASFNFNSLGTATSVSVEVFPNTFPDNMPPNSKAVKRYFTITTDGTGFNANMKLYYKDVEVVGFTNGENNLALYKWTGDGWSLAGGTVNTTGNFITLNNVTSFSTWAIGDPNDNPLPVELSSFVINVIGFNVHLNWMTATETNNLGFEIERARITPDYRDMKWENISFLQSAGTTTEIRRYSYVDANLLPGNYLYRLRIIDHDGSFSYSTPVSAEVEMPRSYTLEQNYPNPFNPATTIAFTLPEQAFVSVRIYNALGKEVATLFSGNKDAGTYEMNFDASNIPSGVYYYTLNANGFSKTNKMILMK